MFVKYVEINLMSRFAIRITIKYILTFLYYFVFLLPSQIFHFSNVLYKYK